MTSVKKDKPSVFVEFAKAVINGGKIIGEDANGVDCYSAVVDVNGGDIAGDRALELYDKSKAIVSGGHFTGMWFSVVKRQSLFRKSPRTAAFPSRVISIGCFCGNLAAPRGNGGKERDKGMTHDNRD